MAIELRKWRETDYEDFFRLSNNDKLYKNMSDAFPKTLESCRKCVCSFANNIEETQCARAIIVDGEVAGSIGAFLDSGLYCKNAEIAYWLGSQFWNRGIMSLVIEKFADHVFLNYAVERIYARPFVRNIGSRKALEKAGFEPEGILRKSAFKDGQSMDTYMYSLLRR
jgi:ribosomal-protein-alanine N-acetyltransferase